MGRCTGKVRHAAKLRAQIARKRMRKRGVNIGDLSVYECEACGGWHVGGHRKLKQAAINRLVNRALTP